MEQTPVVPAEIQFDRAELSDSSPESFHCEFCKRSLNDVYFDVNGTSACEACRYEVENLQAVGSGIGRFTRALAAGSGAAVVGSGIYYAVLALTGYEIGLVAIAVGLLVGIAVRWGARGRGGWAYQTLAMALTYVAIVSTYVPFIIAEVQKQEAALQSTEGATSLTTEEAIPDSMMAKDEPQMSAGEAVAAILVFFGLVLAIPFLAGVENIIGIVIIGIGLYEAWKINRRSTWVVEGPFRVGTGPRFDSASAGS